MKRIFTVRFWLFMFLFGTMIFAGWSMYYKITRWGFSFKPSEKTDVWTIEANISFKPVDKSIKISMAAPDFGDSFKILAEDVVGSGYNWKKDKNRILIENTKKISAKKQHIYYRVLLFDNEAGEGKTKASQPPLPQKPEYDTKQIETINEILELSRNLSGDEVQKVIRLLNQLPAEPVVSAFLPPRKTQKAMSEVTRKLLAFKGIPNRQVRGIRLEENKKTSNPDLMLEAYVGGKWKIYDLITGKKGLPENFIILQKGENSMLDISGGEDSSLKFSVLKSLQSTFALAGHRAKLAHDENNYNFSMYSLPLLEQNTLKWFTIFPLAVLLVVLMRNVVGMHTMGTFTPMLLSMSLIRTGFLAGLSCFLIIVALGFAIRALLSRLNLLLVPRISAVLIFVLLIIQALTVIGYRMNLDIASSALFFPVIITAWIVERASITLEEGGPKDCIKELFNTLLAAVLVYFVISNEYIRHIMFAFNELNVVILAIIMLLGTYTGYRLNELSRFMSLIKENKNA